MLDKMKDLGFKYSTIAGITVSMSDLVASDRKSEIVANAQKDVDNINKQYKPISKIYLRICSNADARKELLCF